MNPHDPNPDAGTDVPEPPAPEAENIPAATSPGGRRALRVDTALRPGWIRGTDRTPVVGEPAYCVGGEGAVAALHGRTGDGSRLVEIRFGDGKKPFYAAASNILLLAD